MPITCITCGSSMPDVSEFCPACGRAVQPAQSTEPASPPIPVPPTAKVQPPPILEPFPEAAIPPPPPVVLNDRLCAAASYFTFIPAVAFLFMKPYARRRFVRFHSLQSCFFWVLVIALLGVGVLASSIGFLLLWLFTGTLVVLALFLTWLLLSIKALQGEWFQLPGFGRLMEQMGRA
jgi:uncharacterized membrane protein